MPQTVEADSFLARVLSLPHGPGISLDAILQPSLDDEAELRRLFATDKTNARLDVPHVGLVDIFDAPADIRTTRARIVNDENLAAKYVMPLSETQRRAEGAPAMAADLEEFQKNWAIFTEGSLSQLFDWNNVVAAGGAVLACLSPLSDEDKVSKRAIRKYFHSAAYPTSDVDLFLWGLTPEQAEVKINDIYEAVRDAVPWDVTCVRTKHTVSIHSQYPCRPIQIILRLYKSPAEILAGFDIDAPCCAYDGDRVWANPRAVIAMMRQCNTVDMTRRSPSYEVRLVKYSSRGFEVFVPTLRRSEVDPTIYERSIIRIEGLARLLVLEKLMTTEARSAFLESRRHLRGRPNPLNVYSRRKRRYYPGDLKDDTSIGGLELNDYDVSSLHIPYGRGWDARRIDKLVYQTDLGMNSTFNPKNKGRRLHRHPAFFGTIRECLEDCCEHCPEPITEDETKLAKEEEQSYIKGRISFMEENPGRQSISGSFNPIDVGEWSEQVYIGQTEKFFAAIAAHDRTVVSKSIKEGANIDRRDHVGRTPLHVAILCTAVDIACDLIDAGARMTARVVDGRTSLHLAVQLDQLVIVRKLLERSVFNAERARVAGTKARGKRVKSDDRNSDVDVDLDGDNDRASSEDDWSSDEADHADKDGEKGGKDDDGDEENQQRSAMPPPESNAGDLVGIPDNDEGMPDVFDVNVPDWDFSFTPLMHAVLFASLPVLEELLTAGADAKLATKANFYNAPAFHPLALTILAEDEGRAVKVAERLLLAGASSSEANDELVTIFHRAVAARKTKLVSALLRCDPNADTVLNFPCVRWEGVIYPITTALSSGSYSMLGMLLAHGAKLLITEEDITRAKAMRKGQYYRPGSMTMAFMPADVAVAMHDDVLHLLAALGADLNIPIKLSLERPMECSMTLLDYVRHAVKSVSDQIPEEETQASVPHDGSGWKGYHARLVFDVNRVELPTQKDAKAKNIRALNGIKDYFVEVERLLVSHNAKTWEEAYPDQIRVANAGVTGAIPTVETRWDYDVFGPGHQMTVAPEHLRDSYNELMEACFAGDNDKIQKLCLPAGEPTPGSDLLQISVEMRVRSDPSQYLMRGGMGITTGLPGVTPLFAAVCGRKWDTARLILAIAAAQYAPKEQDKKFSTKGIVLHDDSDNESDASDESGDTVNQEEINFTDVAKRPSLIKCHVPPSKMLERPIRWTIQKSPDSEINTRSDNILVKAIIDNDLEAFVHIMNWYTTTLPEPIQVKSRKYLQSLVSWDRVDLLDEYIRRTGSGISVNTPKTDSAEEIIPDEKDKVYLGLSVHGKKRLDLATKNDPNATKGNAVADIPLLWDAARLNAPGIIAYLSGDRPLAAYRFYSSTHSDLVAERLRRASDLESVLPEWLGWTISPFNESPLTAAILGKNLEMVKKLFAHSPKFMASTLHESIKFLGYNPLMLAVSIGCDAALFDFLLAKGISPAENDIVRKWNIFHLLAWKGPDDLLSHLLRKLPPAVVDTLLAQQSKGRLNTPLHLAVKNGRKRAVKLLLEFNQSNLLVRDVNGSVPLHAAVRQGFAEIVQLLLEAGPAEVLLAENGIGETPLETACLRETIERRQKFNPTVGTPLQINKRQVGLDPERFSIPRQEGEITQLKGVIDELLRHGKLKNTKLPNELMSFANKMDVKLAAAKKAAAAVDAMQSTAAKNEVDCVNRVDTLERVRKGVLPLNGPRGLVHLIDVQRSVEESLGQLKKEAANGAKQKHDDGPEPKDDENKNLLSKGQVYAFASIFNDRW